MAGSLFTEFLGKTYDAAVKAYYSLKNDKAQEPVYSYPTLFPEEYSFDGKWTSTSVANTRVTADVVALDSSIPLKRRDSLKKVTGEIPKQGLKYALNENEMRQIQVLKALGKDDRVIDLLYRDSGRVVDGIQESLEYQGLQAFSTGTIVIPKDDDPTLAVRVDYGIDADNWAGVPLVWSNASANPIEDIKNKILKPARRKAINIRFINMGYDKAQEFLNNAKVIEYYGNFLNFTGSNIPTPNLEKINAALGADLRFQIVVWDRQVIKEAKDGTRRAVECWDNNMVVGSVSNAGIGLTVYTDLAEEEFKAEQATYNKVGSFILVSKYHDVDPIREYTKSEATVLPVLQNIDSLYYLDTSDTPSASDTQTEGDANILVKTNTVTRANFIAALNNVGVSKASSRNTDATLLGYYNDLNDENEDLVDTELGI